MKKIFATILLLLASTLCFAQSETLTEKKNKLRTEIFLEINEITKDSTAILVRLEEMTKKNERSEEEIAELKAEIAALQELEKKRNEKEVEYINTINEEENQIKAEKDRNRRLSKILFVIAVILILMVVVKVVIMYAKIKWNITLPYWLNNLL